MSYPLRPQKSNYSSSYIAFLNTSYNYPFPSIHRIIACLSHHSLELLIFVNVNISFINPFPNQECKHSIASTESVSNLFLKSVIDNLHLMINHPLLCES